MASLSEPSLAKGHRRPSRRARRDRGFSLVVIFLLMVVMTGTAIGVLIAGQTDLNLAGISREQQLALHAAEYAAARGKALIASQTQPMFDATTGWNGLLLSTSTPIVNAMCSTTLGVATPGSTPGVRPQGAPVLLYSLRDRSGVVIPGADVQWSYCIHNNADDPGYLAPIGVPNGNVDDSRDVQHLLVIEGYGWAPNGASARISVTVGTPTLNSNGGVGSYAQEGAGGVHTGEGGANEAGISVGSGRVTF